MLTVHHTLAFLVIGVCLLATVFALVAYRTRGGAGALVTHVLALAQPLTVAQAAAGLLLLADHRRAEKGVHYKYGCLAGLGRAWPRPYAPGDPRRRPAWIPRATPLAAVPA